MDAASVSSLTDPASRGATSRQDANDGIQGWLDEFHMRRSRVMLYGVPSLNQMPQAHYYACHVMSDSGHGPMDIPEHHRRSCSRSSSSSSGSTSRSSLFEETEVQITPSRSSSIDHMVGFQRQTTPNLGTSRLPCEFVRYHDCGATFDIDDEEGWIAHIAHHLCNKFPPHCICWFCNREFVAQSDSLADCWVSYHARMLHIAQHFRIQHLVASQIRPDFFFLDHLHHHMLIRVDMYNHEIINASELIAHSDLTSSTSSGGFDLESLSEDGGTLQIPRENHSNRGALGSLEPEDAGGSRLGSKSHPEDDLSLDGPDLVVETGSRNHTSSRSNEKHVKGSLTTSNTASSKTTKEMTPEEIAFARRNAVIDHVMTWFKVALTRKLSEWACGRGDRSPENATIPETESNPSGDRLHLADTRGQRGSKRRKHVADGEENDGMSDDNNEEETK
ncbi:hypothetical protein EDB81DRAFT_77383 [Dactylonectria macrodidyma]|uniref:Uncharacterized protein n=1 Tax=Dactylonectria macrodidyma TaxID=307937 RepID=A0A9P9IZN8_9HYPO|nr:hypothetical protein EDB81DRAFT_77383 [Dactylonectria macrodidyma]